MDLNINTAFGIEKAFTSLCLALKRYDLISGWYVDNEINDEVDVNMILWYEREDACGDRIDVSRQTFDPDKLEAFLAPLKELAWAEMSKCEEIIQAATTKRLDLSDSTKHTWK